MKRDPYQNIRNIVRGNPTDFISFAHIAPAKQGHYRSATCAETRCGFYLNGWKTICTSDQAELIRKSRIDGVARKFTETALPDGRIEFVFEAHQQCFDWPNHKVGVGPPLLLKRGGDFRANTGLIRRHTNPQDWIEDMHEHMDGLADLHRKEG